MKQPGMPFTPLHRPPIGAARLEWIQLWAGVDCETEWFDIGESGVSTDTVVGARFSAVPANLHAEASSEEVRIRAVIRVDDLRGCRLQLRGVLAPGSQVLVRDAFGCDILQAVEGPPSLMLELGVGRFSVDAVLLPKSSISAELLRAAARRARPRTKSAG
ncbi:MAG: hypothetical protein ACK5WD_09210 [bacterium]